MAKPTKHAPLICIIVGAFALIGIIFSLILHSAIPALILLLPTVVYEIYRTEGESTKISSIIIGVVLVLELVLVLLNIDYDLAALLGEDSRYIAGHEVPLGSITVVGPTVMAILSAILFVRTRGVYTRALAAIIIVVCFVIIYEINPNALNDLFKIGIEEALDRLSYI